MHLPSIVFTTYLMSSGLETKNNYEGVVEERLRTTDLENAATGRATWRHLSSSPRNMNLPDAN